MLSLSPVLGLCSPPCACSNLPLGFPKDAPVVTVSPLGVHPWINAEVCVCGVCVVCVSCVCVCVRVYQSTYICTLILVLHVSSLTCL